MYFRKEYEFLSNMYCHPISVHFKSGDIIRFKCVESAFQAMKCTTLTDIMEFTMLNGFEARRQGRRVHLRANWEKIKIPIMKKLLLIKFSEPRLRNQLLAISEPIIEDNTWGDTFWGKCKGVGKNMLGQLLMEVREELK